MIMPFVNPSVKDICGSKFSASSKHPALENAKIIIGKSFIF